jgi:hypothetical protein
MKLPFLKVAQPEGFPMLIEVDGFSNALTLIWVNVRDGA